MIFPKKYRILKNNKFTLGLYRIIPIRFEDQSIVMQWRNDQINILRQKSLLTAEQQDQYFTHVLLKNFNESQPDQLIFSFFKSTELIGYGGLVHIDWKSKNAEISFLLSTKLNDPQTYKESFEIFLDLMIKLAIEAEMHKIFTFGYDVASYRFEPLISRKFNQEACLKKHINIDGIFLNALIYSKFL